LEAAASGDQTRVVEEIGDLQFAVVNLARHLKVEPEPAMQTANEKFERRFRAVESRLVELGIDPVCATLEQMDRAWDEVKAAEKSR
ncbi:MAG TPA: nucleoside triphosphate pyrophosphohydrolase, partial [Gammaproteobacteria bacterium]|nr:nucleoside triphosphate pyrophosphohydrolase [Gammaproteobacteria bacterium]